MHEMTRARIIGTLASELSRGNVSKGELMSMNIYALAHDAAAAAEKIKKPLGAPAAQKPHRAPIIEERDSPMREPLNIMEYQSMVARNVKQRGKDPQNDDLPLLLAAALDIFREFQEAVLVSQDTAYLRRMCREHMAPLLYGFAVFVHTINMPLEEVARVSLKQAQRENIES